MNFKSRPFPRGLTLCKMSVSATNSRIQLAVILIWSTIRHLSLNAHKIQCMNGSFFDFLYVQWFISGQRLEKFVHCIIIPLTYEYLRPVLIVNLNVRRSKFFEDASHIRSLYAYDLMSITIIFLMVRWCLWPNREIRRYFLQKDRWFYGHFYYVTTQKNNVKTTLLPCQLWIDLHLPVVVVTWQFHLPSQWKPSPWYPGKQVQEKLPSVLVQCANTSQGRYLHSFSSEKLKTESIYQTGKNRIQFGYNYQSRKQNYFKY